jgi:hypothetical protein
MGEQRPTQPSALGLEAAKAEKPTDKSIRPRRGAGKYECLQRESDPGHG